MDVTAVAGIAAQPANPARPEGPGQAREAIGQEFGRMLFHTMLKGAAATPTGGKGHKMLPAMPAEMFSDPFVRQLAVQHQALFAQLLFNNTDEGGAR